MKTKLTTLDATSWLHRAAFTTGMMLLMSLTSGLMAQDAHDHDHSGPADKQQKAAQMKPDDDSKSENLNSTSDGNKTANQDHGEVILHSHAYTLDTCPVSGSPLGSMGEPVVFKHENREIRFCCKACQPKFEADPDKFLQIIDENVIKSQKDTYPLNTCVVSGGKLGGMGEPVDYVHNSRLVRFCCGGCIAKFKSDPDKYLEMIDKAIVDQQIKNYPLKTCLVSGDELGGKMGAPVEYVFGTRLVRFCCKGCVKDFEKNPHLYLKKIDEARSKTPNASADSTEKKSTQHD